MEKKILIYKNDLKFNDNITEDSDFDTDNIKDIKWPENPMMCNSKCTCVHDVKSRKIK